MHRTKNKAIILAGLFSLFSLLGCGQKKPLFLPEEADTNQTQSNEAILLTTPAGGQ